MAFVSASATERRGISTFAGTLTIFSNGVHCNGTFSWVASAPSGGQIAKLINR